MTKKLNILMSAVATAALIAPGALADGDGSTNVTIDQVQLGDVFSNMTVWVGNHVDGDAGAAATSVSNAASGLVTKGDITFSAWQHAQGNTGASTSVTGGDVHDAAYATTTAYANASTGGTWNGNTTYRAEQVNDGTVSATTDMHLRNVNTAGTTTTAIANVSTPSSENGDNRAYSEQTNNGSSYATTNVSLCCDNEAANFTTIAGGNAVTSTGWTTTLVNGAVQVQNDYTEIVASSDVYINNGTDVSASATAAANSYTATNEFGYATLGRAGSELYQGNEAHVSAGSNVSLNHWNGHATSTAYGVGNTALISNVGSDTGLYAIQGNYGDVSSHAELNGSSYTGGIGVVNSTAIGNAATATLCTACGEASLHGAVNQTNAGSIYAGASVHSTHAGSIFGSATAVGNSATFTASGD